jgi:hypothetical protein
LYTGIPNPRPGYPGPQSVPMKYQTVVHPGIIVSRDVPIGFHFNSYHTMKLTPTLLAVAASLQLAGHISSTHRISYYVEVA